MGVGAGASSIIGIEGVGAGMGAGASASLSVALTSDLLRTPARAAAIIEPCATTADSLNEGGKGEPWSR